MAIDREKLIGGEKGRELAREVSNMLNSFNDDNMEAFVDEMNREHRTLQQNFMKLLVFWIRLQAEKTEHQYDARNEASVLLAKQIVEKLENRLHLPLI